MIDGCNTGMFTPAEPDTPSAMKTHILFLGISALILQTLHAQTYVSGGIYTNTTWTAANSPYIVTDTIVVFPGVSLTLQPGVTVKFGDNKRIEIRQAKLVAMGSADDSIRFTSNSASPAPGIYAGIYLNGGNHTSVLDYCTFSYADIGLNATVTDSLVVDHSDFRQNITGLQFIGAGINEVATVGQSLFRNNISQGLLLKKLRNSAISFCNFTNNGSEGLLLDDMQGQMAVNLDDCNFSYNATGMRSSMHHLHTDRCNFLNNGNGLEGFGYMSPFDSYSNTVKNSVFNFNETGIAGIARMQFDSCTMSHNQSGSISGGVNRIRNCSIDSNNVLGISTFNDSVINCRVNYNGEGIRCGSLSVISGNTIEFNTGANISSAAGTTVITGNTISNGAVGIDNTEPGTMVITHNVIENNNLGINLAGANTGLTCNRICNNTTYDLKYNAAGNLEAGHNYWCTPDSAATEAVIYDGYDNINDGIVSFMPLDSLCYLLTSIQETELKDPVHVYPNPFSAQAIIHTDKIFRQATLQLFNAFGQEVREVKNISAATFNLDRNDLPAGLYILKVLQDNKVFSTKIVITDR